jgi:hypothetical protein
MPTVNLEVGIGGEKNGIGENFGHSHEASIREAHRHVRVFLHQLQDFLGVLTEMESADDNSATQQRGEGRTAATPEQVKCLRQGGFACPPRRRKAR